MNTHVNAHTSIACIIAHAGRNIGTAAIVAAGVVVGCLHATTAGAQSRPSHSNNQPTPPTTAATPQADSAADRTGFGGDVIDAATREYRERGIARAVTQGNLVVFPFGHAEPVLTCTVLRACIIELEAGEAVQSEPIAGDQVRWIIAGAKSGPAASNTLVVVKPKDCDITTNLVIPTDRRIYDLTLDSPPCQPRSAGTSNHRASAASSGGTSSTTSSSTNPQQPFVRHVRFYYPDDEANRLASGFATASARHTSPSISLEHLNFDYRVRKDRKFPWAPAQVFDDGSHVFIKLPPEARTSVAPVLFGLEEDGTRTIVNYTVREDLYVADRTFRRGVLVIGDGKQEQKVELENRAFGKAVSASKDR